MVAESHLGSRRPEGAWITPDKIVQSIRLVKTGKVYELGHVYEREMRGLSNQRTYNLFLVGPFLTGGENKFVDNDEFVSGALGQIGTSSMGSAMPRCA